MIGKWKIITALVTLSLVGIFYSSNVQQLIPWMKMFDEAGTKLKIPQRCSCISVNSTYIQSHCHPRRTDTSVQNRTLYLLLGGRLGNNLFQIASAYAMTKDTNAQLAVVYDKALEVFSHKPFKTITKEEWNNLRIRYINGDLSFTDYIRAFQAALSEDFKFNHYLVRYVYFGGCQDEIRRELAFRNDIIVKADDERRRLVENHRNLTQDGKKIAPITVVGIHVRRGDLTSQSRYKQGYRLPGVLYFQNAMKYFKKRYSNVIFIVATNGKEWVTRNLLGPNIYLSGLEDPAQDMALISRCDHAITSLMTYSWWCGFFNRGTVIYYKNWTEPNSVLWKRRDYKEHELFPPYWIPMT